MQLALYSPGTGFYATGRRGGPRADFLTAVEASPLFGFVVATYALRLWSRARAGNRLLVIELGGASGTLLGQVGSFLGFEPAVASGAGRKPGKPLSVSSPDLLYGSGYATAHARSLPLTWSGALVGLVRDVLVPEPLDPLPDVTYLLVDPGLPPGESLVAWRPGEGERALARSFEVRSFSELDELVPHDMGVGWRPASDLLRSDCTVVVANEVFDNVPSHLLIRSGDRVDEIGVGIEGGRLCLKKMAPSQELSIAGSALPGPDAREHATWRKISDLPEEFKARLAPSVLSELTPDALVGVVSPLQARLASRVAAAVEGFGAVLIFDLPRNPYEAPVVTYAGHTQGFDPLESPGNQDVMVPVSWEVIRLALSRAGFRVEEVRSQASWLSSNGIDDVVGVLAEAVGGARPGDRRDAAAHWDDSPPPPEATDARQRLESLLASTDEPLQAVAARSLVVSARALSDPQAFGSFWVLEALKGLRSLPQ